LESTKKGHYNIKITLKYAFDQIQIYLSKNILKEIFNYQEQIVQNITKIITLLLF